jgi:lysozyme
VNPFIKDLLIRDEGLRLTAYKCTAGKTTIGVGRNLDDVGISAAEADLLLQNDLAHIEAQALTFPWYVTLDAVRQAVILSLIFNLGLRGFQGFVNTIKSIEAGNYADAAERLMESKWAKQVGQRANRLSEMMRTGVCVRR